MKAKTRELWDKQNQHRGDRWRLFRAIGKVLAPETVLYAGSYVDIAPSFIFPDVTYVDIYMGLSISRLRQKYATMKTSRFCIAMAVNDCDQNGLYRCVGYTSWQ